MGGVEKPVQIIVCSLLSLYNVEHLREVLNEHFCCNIKKGQQYYNTYIIYALFFLYKITHNKISKCAAQLALGQAIIFHPRLPSA